MLPNFLIAGAQKSGSTTLWEACRLHDQIFVAEEKELEFFWSRRVYSRGLSWYESHFAGRTTEMAVGEATPSYLYQRWAAKAIADAIPHVRLIFCLRNPIDRAYSQYWDYRRRLRESRSFDEVATDVNSAYIQRGMYAEQLTRFLDYFPPDQLLILLYEELRDNPTHCLAKCFAFLGVDPNVDDEMARTRANSAEIPANPAYRAVLQRPWTYRLLPRRGKSRGALMRLLRAGPKRRFRYPEMNYETRRRLIDVFADSNQRLSELINADLRQWNV